MAHGALFWSVAATGFGTFLFARERMGALVSTAVSWHIIAGLLIAIPLIPAAREWRSFVPAGASVLTAIICSLTGVALAALAAAGVGVGRFGWVGVLHIAAGVGLAILALTASSRSLRSRAPGLNGLVAVGALGLASLGAASYRADDYFRALTSTNPTQASNPLFPAGAKFEQGDPHRAASSAECGRSGCHAGIAGSAVHTRHARAAESVQYQEGIARAHIAGGAGSERWCMGCHSPMGLTKSADRSGVGCLACHAMRDPSAGIGGGTADYGSPEPYPFDQSGTPAGKWINGFFTRVRPAPHRAALSVVGDGNRVCLPCHRMNVTAAQNRYGRVAVDDTWGDWQASPQSGESVHGATMARVRRSCIDCHSGTSHGEPGSPPAGGTSGVGLEVFALRRQAAVPGGLERLDAPLASRQVFLQSGETVSIDVLVENQRGGHGFPVDGSSVKWALVRLTAEDEKGRLLMGSTGGLDGGHPYGQALVDRRGELVTHSACQSAITTVWRRTLMPGAPDLARFQLKVPSIAGRLTLRASLVTVGAGQAPEAAIARHQVDVSVRSGGAAAPERVVSQAGPRDDTQYAHRFYAYGLALLSQHDVPRAIRAFRQAESLEPKRAEFLIGLARAHMEEGDLLSARSELEYAAALDSGGDSARAWLGRALRLMGQYDLALDYLRPVAERHPGDAQTWFDTGLCLLRSGRYEEAVEPFRKMLSIDPNDASGHVNLLQCYRSLRRWTEARREEGIYRALHDDLSPTQAVEAYLQSHPTERLETAAIHEHVLMPAKSGGAR